MGTFFNPGNDGFECDRNDLIYIDKTGLLEFLNSRLRTSSRCISLSHARRFGKSHAAGMIEAYYSKGCDSSKIFAGTKITQSPSYKEHLNKYNVIHIDISSLWDSYKPNIIEEIRDNIYEEIKKEYHDKISYKENIALTLAQAYDLTKIPFVIIIDEWDCVIRNSDDQELIHRYLQFLHELYKSKEAKSFLALGYITGILPIKKIEDESALNNFREYTMLRSYPITEYYGFTEEEVQKLCQDYKMDFGTMQNWYDGYLIDGKHMWNPNSVVQAIQNREFNSYWKNTSAFETINNFITLNYDGLKEDVMSMLAGNKVLVDTETFSNDLNSISSKDEALTALIHLGYLAYDKEKECAYIPNFEVKKAYQAALQKGSWKEIAKSISCCNEILKATIEEDAQKVAELLEFAHDTYASLLKYNDENSLSCVITMAYFTAPAYYNIVREFPTGKGFADIVFIPRENAGYYPAIVVELKYNESADTAIKQIKDKRYAGALNGYAGKILLVGVNYEKQSKNKKHTCIIEEFKA